MLSILLSDPLFNTDDEMIVDECLTFFFAGSQTSSVTTQNLVLHLLKHPHYKEKIVEEIREVVVRPKIKDTKWEPSHFLDLIEYDDISELSFYSQCFNESLRM